MYSSNMVIHLDHCIGVPEKFETTFQKKTGSWQNVVVSMAMGVGKLVYFMDNPIEKRMITTWWFIPLTKWVTTPVGSGFTLLIPVKKVGWTNPFTIRGMILQVGVALWRNGNLPYQHPIASRTPTSPNVPNTTFPKNCRADGGKRRREGTTQDLSGTQRKSNGIISES